jgi:hypothetical protein
MKWVRFAVFTVIIFGFLAVPIQGQEPYAWFQGEARDYTTSKGSMLTVRGWVTALQQAQMQSLFYAYDLAAGWKIAVHAPPALQLNEPAELTIDFQVPSDALSGTYGMVLNGEVEGEEQWQWIFFVNVEEEKVLGFTQERVSYSGYISGENTPRTIMGPNKYSFPLTVWVKNVADHYRNFWLDLIIHPVDNPSNYQGTRGRYLGWLDSDQEVSYTWSCTYSSIYWEQSCVVEIWVYSDVGLIEYKAVPFEILCISESTPPKAQDKTMISKAPAHPVHPPHP